MTYPPQGGQFPDPNQQPGGYPQHGQGGYPQQPPGGYPPQGPPPGGYPPQGPGGYPPQGPPPGGFPPQGGMPPQQPKKKTGLFIGLGVGGFLVLVLIVVLVVALSGGGPSAPVKGLISAVENRDLDAVKENLCQKQRDQIQEGEDLGMSEQDFFSGIEDKEMKKWEIIDESENGNEGTVTVKAEGEDPETVDVVLEDGEWKVCEF